MRKATRWTSGELARTGEGEELEIASPRPDGDLRNPVTIWVVRHDDDLYVRSVNGPGSAWYRGAQMRREGRIRAGGVEVDVALEDANGEMNDRIDDEYRMKYGRYSENTINRITSPEARSTTMRLVPRPTSP